MKQYKGELNKKQIADLGLAEAVSKKEILHGLAEISAYTGKSISAIRRAIKRGQFPAAHNGDKKGKYITTKQNIDIWIGTKHLEIHNPQPATKHQDLIRNKLYAHLASKQ